MKCNDRRCEQSNVSLAHRQECCGIIRERPRYRRLGGRIAQEKQRPAIYERCRRSVGLVQIHNRAARSWYAHGQLDKYKGHAESENGSGQP